MKAIGGLEVQKAKVNDRTADTQTPNHMQVDLMTLAGGVEHRLNSHRVRHRHKLDEF